MLVYVKRVVLEDIRPFERAEFDFERPERGPFAGWNAITGDNASGKSTVLRAIALALLGPDQARGLGESFAGWVRHGADTGTIAVQLKPGGADRFAGGGVRSESFWAELQIERQGAEAVVRPGTRFRKNEKGATNGPWRPGTEKWFAVGYGPFRRLRGSAPEAARMMARQGRAPRFGTMFKEDATLAESVEWLKDLKFRELEGSEADKRVFREVVEVLNASFSRHAFQIERVTADGVFLRATNGLALSLDEMSDGFRAALAMLTDILRHLATVYGPEGLVEQRDGRSVVPHSGVVLVDEVDAHLHPEWQRTIGFWLKEQFPGLQFIVSSHSPLVCQATDPGGLYALGAPPSSRGPVRVSEEERLRIIASRPDAILTSTAFGLEETRSPLAVENRREYARLKARERAGLATDRDRARERQLRLFAETDNG